MGAFTVDRGWQECDLGETAKAEMRKRAIRNSETPVKMCERIYRQPIHV